MIKNVFSYLNLNNIGAFEFFLTLYPILAGYGWGFLTGKLLFIILLLIWTIQLPKKKNINFKWLKILIGFVMLHEILLMFIIPVQSYFINNTLSIILISISVIPISRSVDYQKFVGSLNLVAVISIIGLLYQLAMIMRGLTVHPIKLPFLPEMTSDTRLYEEGVRPTSFFWEPAALVTFLMVPLFISLHEKKYIWSIILILSMFLSTSSTGILMSIVMLVVYVFTQKITFRTRILVVVLGICMVYGLTHSSYFEAGVEKIENTDPKKNKRLNNGLFLYDAMSEENLIFGIPAANVVEFFDKNGGMIFRSSDGSIFVPAFWLVLGKYGFIGMFLYLMVYISIEKKDPTTIPYIIVLFISMFFQVVSNIGANTFTFQLIFLYSYISRHYYINKASKRPKMTYWKD